MEKTKRVDTLDNLPPTRVRRVGQWTEQFSSNGRRYFYNQESEISQWDKPQAWLDAENNMDGDDDDDRFSYTSLGRISRCGSSPEKIDVSDDEDMQLEEEEEVEEILSEEEIQRRAIEAERKAEEERERAAKEAEYNKDFWYRKYMDEDAMNAKYKQMFGVERNAGPYTKDNYPVHLSRIVDNFTFQLEYDQKMIEIAKARREAATAEYEANFWGRKSKDLGDLTQEMEQRRQDFQANFDVEMGELVAQAKCEGGFDSPKRWIDDADDKIYEAHQALLDHRTDAFKEKRARFMELYKPKDPTPVPTPERVVSPSPPATTVILDEKKLAELEVRSPSPEEEPMEMVVSPVFDKVYDPTAREAPSHDYSSRSSSRSSSPDQSSLLIGTEPFRTQEYTRPTSERPLEFILEPPPALPILNLAAIEAAERKKRRSGRESRTPPRSPSPAATMNTPVFSPYHSPRSPSPIRSPVRSPIHVPQSPAYSPPIQSPVLSPIYSPRSPIVSPVQSPIVSPARSPIVSPHISPSRSPVRSPVVSPHLSPVGSPVRSPVVSPVLSPLQSPVRSPVRSPSPNYSHVKSPIYQPRSPEPPRRSTCSTFDMFDPLPWEVAPKPKPQTPSPVKPQTPTSASSCKSQTPTPFKVHTPTSTPVKLYASFSSPYTTGEPTPTPTTTPRPNLPSYTPVPVPPPPCLAALSKEASNSRFTLETTPPSRPFQAVPLPPNPPAKESIANFRPTLTFPPPSPATLDITPPARPPIPPSSTSLEAKAPFPPVQLVANPSLNIRPSPSYPPNSFALDITPPRNMFITSFNALDTPTRPHIPIPPNPPTMDSTSTANIRPSPTHPYSSTSSSHESTPSSKPHHPYAPKTPLGDTTPTGIRPSPTHPYANCVTNITPPQTHIAYPPPVPPPVLDPSMINRPHFASFDSSPMKRHPYAHVAHSMESPISRPPPHLDPALMPRPFPPYPQHSSLESPLKPRYPNLIPNPLTLDPTMPFFDPTVPPPALPHLLPPPPAPILDPPPAPPVLDKLFEECETS